MMREQEHVQHSQSSSSKCRFWYQRVGMCIVAVQCALLGVVCSAWKLTQLSRSKAIITELYVVLLTNTAHRSKALPKRSGGECNGRQLHRLSVMSCQIFSWTRSRVWYTKALLLFWFYLVATLVLAENSFSPSFIWKNAWQK